MNNEVLKNHDTNLLCPLHFEYEVVIAITIQRLYSFSRIFTTTVAHKCKTLEKLLTIILITDIIGDANLGVLGDLVFGKEDSFDVPKV